MRPAGTALAAILVLGVASTPAVAPAADTGPAGVFVVGIDGMDPVILRRFMAAGSMPNFDRLTREGTLQSLGTSNPPQSPVAWSNFVTGMNPGGHGIYDFIHRDPTSYHPVSSATKPMHGDPPRTIEIRGYEIPLGGETPENNRDGKPFWDVLVDAGVDVEVYRMPANYPPTPSDAKTLSGMGTVDLRGEFGTYNWFTTELQFGKKKVKGDVQVVRIDGGTIETFLKGPPDPFHPPESASDKVRHLQSPFTVHVDPENDAVWIRLGSAQALLQAGEWSEWMPVTFEALPMGLMNLEGITRFYLKQVRPTFQLYASPINISPRAPASPITTPDDWVVELGDELGPFFTQGMPEEVNALKDGLFDDDDYERQVGLVHDETGRMVELALQRFERGDTTFVYLSEIDLQSHMLWRHGDPKHPGAPPHPAFEPEAARDHADDIAGYYRRVDGLLGRIREALPPDTLLLVMSDHGFQPFTRQLHLNDWLRQQGFLYLRDAKTRGSIPAGDVDWKRTRAYAYGFNGLYLNLEGRERDGIVDPAEQDGLLGQLEAGLLALRDPASGARVVRRVDRAAAVYSGDRLPDAPDLVIGYEAGYGGSDESTLGELTGDAEPLQDNTSRWSGNHLMAPDVVPGVLLVNRKLAADGHDLTDLTATLLHHYGLPPAPGMVGEPIF